MPSDPRPKPLPFADAPSAEAVDAAAKAAKKAKTPYPEGASVGEPPAEGVWFALVTEGGNLAESGGQPVRVP